MIYNLKKVTGAYVKGFWHYVIDKKLDTSKREDLYDLFSYCIKTIHSLPAPERNYFTEQYGDECIQALKKLKGVPKKIEKLGLNDRLSIVTMCKSYFVAVGLLNEKKGLI